MEHDIHLLPQIKLNQNKDTQKCSHCCHGVHLSYDRVKIVIALRVTKTDYN